MEIVLTSLDDVHPHSTSSLRHQSPQNAVVEDTVEFGFFATQG